MVVVVKNFGVFGFVSRWTGIEGRDLVKVFRVVEKMKFLAIGTDEARMKEGRLKLM